MQHLTKSVRASIRERNWYAALIGALVLPDICARLEDPAVNGSQRRYAAWFERNMANNYRLPVGRELHTFLTGDDCYALRCAYSHEGDFDISNQRARKVLESFSFVVAPPGTTIHLNQINTRLQLQVDLFCEEVCQAVDDWMKRVSALPEVQARIAKLPQIIVWGPGAQL